jgi:propanol-preferring alcohol dehydrogenase
MTIFGGRIRDLQYMNSAGAEATYNPSWTDFHFYHQHENTQRAQSQSSTTTKMQAWKCHVGDPTPQRVEVPIPDPGPEEVLLEVLAMGVCHTDCTILGLKEPVLGMGAEFVMGHEGVGEIVRLGSKVDGSQFAVGDRVGVYLNAGCEQAGCLQCDRGLQQLCKSEGGHYGIGRNGLFAEYAAIHQRAAFHIPPEVDDTLAAVSADAVVTAYHAVKYTAAVQPEQTIVIYGLGGLGFNALQTALHLKVKRILVVDKRQESVDEAIKLGIPAKDAFCTVDSAVKKLHEVVAEQQIAVDTCIDFVGVADTVTSAQMTLRPAGTLVLVGVLGEQAPLIPIMTVCNGLTIKGSYNGSRQAYRECLELMEKGVLKPKVQTGSIEKLPGVLKDLDDGKIDGRMVLLPDWKR